MTDLQVIQLKHANNMTIDVEGEYLELLRTSKLG